MRKLYIVGLVAVAALVIGIAIADEITFSTYYPAPAGMYREFSTTAKTTLATDEWGIEGANARVGIGTTNPQEILDVTSTSSGFLPPRMSNFDLQAIKGTATRGSVAYNTTDDELNYHDGTDWRPIGGGMGELAPGPEGSATFPSGLIMKWGVHEVAAGEIVTFATSFPEACFQVVASGGVASDGYQRNVHTYDITKTNFKMHIGHAAIERGRWLAVGY